MKIMIMIMTTIMIMIMITAHPICSVVDTSLIITGHFRIQNLPRFLRP